MDPGKHGLNGIMLHNFKGHNAAPENKKVFHLINYVMDVLQDEKSERLVLQVMPMKDLLGKSVYTYLLNTNCCSNCASKVVYMGFTKLIILLVCPVTDFFFEDAEQILLNYNISLITQDTMRAINAIGKMAKPT